jgi:hypothetical protein
VLAALVVAAIGLPQIRWTDDIKLLTVIDPEMLAEDERVRERVARMDSGRFVVALGSGATSGGGGGGGARRQRRGVRAAGGGARGGRARGVSQPAHVHARAGGAAASVAALRRRGWPRRLDAAFVAEGFNSGSFDKFFADVARTGAAARGGPRAVAAGGSGAVVPRRAGGGGPATVAVLSLVRGVTDAAALRGRLASVPGATTSTSRRRWRTAYGRYRERTLELVVLGLLGVFGMVWLRYRGSRWRWRRSPRRCWRRGRASGRWRCAG